MEQRLRERPHFHWDLQMRSLSIPIVGSFSECHFLQALSGQREVVVEVTERAEEVALPPLQAKSPWSRGTCLSPAPASESTRRASARRARPGAPGSRSDTTGGGQQDARPRLPGRPGPRAPCGRFHGRPDGGPQPEPGFRNSSDPGPDSIPARRLGTQAPRRL